MSVLDKHVEVWLAWLASGSTAASTVRQRRYTIYAFAREYPVLTATPVQIQNYLGQPHRGPEARKSVLATLRGFYRWAVDRDYIDRDPTRLARSVSVPAGVPKPCPEHVLVAALARADATTRLMLLLGAYAGLRRNEIATLHASHVMGASLRVTGKGNKTRRVPIHPLLAGIVGFDAWAIPSPIRPGRHASPDYVASQVEAALGGGWTTHSLRHRFATQAYRATRDIRAVQMLLGHTSPTTTARYVLVNEDALTAAVLAVA